MARAEDVRTGNGEGYNPMRAANAMPSHSAMACMAYNLTRFGTRLPAGAQLSAFWALLFDTSSSIAGTVSHRYKMACQNSPGE